MALEAVLNAIVGIGTVSRGKMDPLMIQRYPSAHLFAGPDQIVESISHIITRNMTVYTYAWVKTPENVHKTLEAWLPKIQQALAADHTLGGLTIDVNEINVDEPMVNAGETEALVLIEHQVTYRVDRQDPYQQA